MKKYLLILLTCVILCISSTTVFASQPVTKTPLVVDNAELLSDTEEQNLTNELQGISTKYNCQVAVVTVKSCEGKLPEEFAENYYRQNSYGMGENHDGILFLVSMEQRDWNFYLSGTCNSLISYSDTADMGAEISKSLGSGKYYEAFSTYGTLVDEHMSSISSDEENTKIGAVVISWVIALVIALVVTRIMKSSLKSANKKIEADNYVGKNSLILSVSNEKFLYKTIDKTKKPQQSKSGGDSSGGSSRGASGKF